MTRIAQNKLFRIDRFAIAIMLCVVVAIGMILGIWWYYDQQIDLMKKDLSKPHTSISTEQ
ncbi:MAG: hypothetical protein KDC07_11380 [Chitinophagaceae bacterium]|nr:hypothetical protein [Chitinophagaceae bacterium]MCB9046240.1 hypothetical protein [Chitinophagales bacterium]